MKFKILTFLLVFLLLVSCNNRKYEKDQNSSDKLRIVSLTPSITKELVDLGVKDRIVGATSYCDITANNKDLIIGSAIAVNMEKILLLQPDIVFASGLTKDKTIQNLRDNGITVYTLEKMNSYDAICDHFLKLAEYVDKKKVAVSMIKASKAKIESLVASIPKRSDSLHVFFQLGTKPIFTVIPNTFMNDYITFAKCKNIAEDMTKGTINREAVLNRNPDIIFIASMGIMGEKEKETWKQYPELKAAKNDKIFIIDANLAAIPTVPTFTESFEIMIKQIYNQ